MREFDDFIRQCQSRLSDIKVCGLHCNHNHYCKESECTEGDCSKCLEHIQWNKAPSFTYSCPKITFHYVLKFFPRFASEICYLLRRCKSEAAKDFNVVSLGCGPGSEVYGIIEAFRNSCPNFHLRYDGFDLNSVWSDVQEISRSCLASSGHDIKFHVEDMFSSPNFPEHVDMLVLNYVLSDVIKHKGEEVAHLCSQIANFIANNNVRCVFFNDISFYGYPDKLDSGVKMMQKICSMVKCKEKRLCRFCFPNDKYIPEGWSTHKTCSLLFPICGPTDETIVVNTYCGSKQIFAVFNY